MMSLYKNCSDAGFVALGGRETTDKRACRVSDRQLQRKHSRTELLCLFNSNILYL